MRLHGAVILLLVFLVCAPAYAAESKTAEFEGVQKEHRALYAKVLSAVVSITAESDSGLEWIRRNARQNRQFEGVPGVSPPQTPTYDHYGSGAVISEDGYILTSLDVVPSDARKINVSFPDGRTAQARLVGYDNLNNIALLKVSGSGYKFLALGDSSKMKIGRRAYTFGSPYAATVIDGSTVFSAGVVSGYYRPTDAGKYRGMALETDATVCGGSDGGAMVDSDGKLIGILDLAHSFSKWQGVAVPIDQIKCILVELKENKVVGPGFLGLKFEIAEGGGAVRVKAVKPESPADKAGFKEGDVIVRFCGEEIKIYETLAGILDDLPPATFFTAVIRRADREQALSGTLDKNPALITERKPPEAKKPEKSAVKAAKEGQKPGFLGVKMATGASEKGVLVEDVMDGSPAALAAVKGKSDGNGIGIQKGDWIVAWDDKKVKSDDELGKLIDACLAGEVHEVRIGREIGGEMWFQTLEVKLTEPPKE